EAVAFFGKEGLGVAKDGQDKRTKDHHVFSSLPGRLQDASIKRETTSDERGRPWVSCPSPACVLPFVLTAAAAAPWASCIVCLPFRCRRACNHTTTTTTTKMSESQNNAELEQMLTERMFELDEARHSITQMAFSIRAYEDQRGADMATIAELHQRIARLEQDLATTRDLLDEMAKKFDQAMKKWNR
ncbi:hypothetical protein IWZ03DRAFT_436766, partial [Phyllosticta citriasiana]